MSILSRERESEPEPEPEPEPEETEKNHFRQFCAERSALAKCMNLHFSYL